MITIEPKDSLISKSDILSVIEKHASTAALLLLPGIQFYSGQYFDIPAITTAARKVGIFVIWDLAHAVGNVPLSLHEWNIDAAAWCSYKYLNAGPGAIAGLFVHDRHGGVSTADNLVEGGSTQATVNGAEANDLTNGAKASGARATTGGAETSFGSLRRPQKQLSKVSSKETPENVNRGFVNRLSGWWGSDKTNRFKMDNRFVPIPGASGFQLSNPSILDITSLNASLEVFEQAGGNGAIAKEIVEAHKVFV